MEERPVKRYLFVPVILLALVLAACGGGGGGGDQSAVTEGSLIEWDRNPNTVIFRADVVGGDEDPFIARSEIPPCTIYGDNHIVWTNELGPFNVQVLEDRLPDDKIRDFVNFLALQQQIYKYAAKSDQQVGSSAAPVVETLTLFVNNVNHVTDAFAGWDHNYYQGILDYCTNISSAPVLYVPSAAWVSAKVVDYDSNAVGIQWDADANGLKLADLAASGDRKWITDRNVGLIWNILRTSPPNTQFGEGDVRYDVALEVPNITRDAPAAPQ
jgi:hypothetical protein